MSNMTSATNAFNSNSDKGSARMGVPIESKRGEKKQRTGVYTSKRINRSKAETNESTATPSGNHPDAKSTNLRKEHESSNTKEDASEDKDMTEAPPQYLVDANLLMKALDLDFLRWLHNGGKMFNDKMIPVTYVLEELRENELVFFKLTTKVFYAATGRSKANFRPTPGSMAMGFEVTQEGKALIMKALNDCKTCVEAEHFELKNRNVDYTVVSPFKQDEKTGGESSTIFYNHTDGKGVCPWSKIDMFVSRMEDGKQVKTGVTSTSEKKSLLTNGAIRAELYFCVPQVWINRRECKLHIKFILDRIVFFPEVDVSTCAMAEKLSRKRKFGDW